MGDWLYRLLGIERGRDALQFDRVFFVQAWPWLAALGAGLALVLWVLRCYYRDGTRPRWWLKSIMVLLRVAAVATVAFMIWQPMLRSQRTDLTRSTVAVLVDESRSMGIRDRWQNVSRRQDLVKATSNPGAARQTRQEVLNTLVSRNDAAVLRELAKTHNVRIYRFGSETEGRDLKTEAAKPDSSSSKPENEVETLPWRPAAAKSDQTRIGSVLDQVLTDTTGQPVAGVVLLSDGGQNMGDDPTTVVRRLADSRIQLHTVGFGDPTPVRDLSISNLLADEVVRKGDEVVVTVAVSHRGFSGQTVPVTLSADGRTLAQTRVTLGRDGERQEVNVSFTPDAPGARTLVATVPGLPGEITLSNNRRAWPIRVIDKKLKILYVEGYPRWEYRFLKNAILRDRTTLFSCILTDADPSLGGEGNQPIFRFPRTRKELFEFDILILGDVPREFFTPTDLKNVSDFVQERGGSLITIAGEMFLPWQYRGSDLETVWPIVVPPSRRETIFREPFQLQLTEAGSRNPMMLFTPDVETNLRIWNNLPGMYWCGEADRVKPGATILARHPSRNGSDGPLPLIALQQVGEGSSLMSMVDSTWLWRFRVGDKFFYRFWGQVVRSMTPHELPGSNRFVRITSDRATYRMGEKVVLRARLLTPNFHPVRLPEVTAELQMADGQRFPVRLDPVSGAAGVYAGEWLPRGAGAYRAVVRSPRGESVEAITNVVVEPSSLELDQPAQNEPLLRRLAAATGGRYLLLSEFDSLPKLLPDRGLQTQTRIEHELWDKPLFLALFLGCLVGEWLLRKKTGLL